MKEIIDALAGGNITIWQATHCVNDETSMEQDAIFWLLKVVDKKSNEHHLGVITDDASGAIQVVDMSNVRPIFSIVHKDTYEITYPPAAQQDAKMSEAIMAVSRLTKVLSQYILSHGLKP
jgi:hypothetical protein